MTTLTDDTTRPSVTKPGDGPADTTDPAERAVSVSPQPAAEALAAGTVNGVRVAPFMESAPRDESTDRFEEYTLTGPGGAPVRVRHNMETGETRQIEE